MKRHRDPASSRSAVPSRSKHGLHNSALLIVPALKSIIAFLLKWAVLGLAFAAVFLYARRTAQVRAPDPVAPVTAPAPNARVPAQQSFADAVARAAPAVVNIYTARIVNSPSPSSLNPLLGQNLPAMRRRLEGSLGSGVIVDARGHIVTNHHVIRGADEIQVQLADGRVAKPTIVGTDADTDLAVLRIDLSPVSPIPMGRSDALRAGDVVLAIGNPFGLSQTVTQGIVSATGRGDMRVTLADFIQTDAAINFGNSGGALINTGGELVGINTAVLAQTLGTEGIGFAIPVNLVRGVLDQILAHGRVRRGWLGVSGGELPRAAARALGIDPPVALVITDIDPRGPAARAGLRADDLVTHLNGETLNSAQDALQRVAGMSPGSTLSISVRRGQQRLELRATLEERPPGGLR